MLRATEKYWELVREYQGIQAPVQRQSTDFDAAANFAVVAGYPLLDQFFSTVLQYQVHEALCKQQGHSGSIHECTLSEATVGAALNDIMTLGASISWQEAILKLTGKSGYNTTALLNYYEPLFKWLQKENENRSCGWHQELGFSALIATGSVVLGCFFFISVIVFYFRIVGPRLEKKFS
jgi:peptidyl-dipeptidase A